MKKRPLMLSFAACGGIARSFPQGELPAARLQKKCPVKKGGVPYPHMVCLLVDVGGKSFPSSITKAPARTGTTPPLGPRCGCLWPHETGRMKEGAPRGRGALSFSAVSLKRRTSS